MSGLIERIVRRRRASASSRLGPPSLNGGSPEPRPHANAGPPEAAPAEITESAPTASPAPEAPAAGPASDPEPPETEPEPAPEPGFRQRGRMRRRARYLRRLREIQLRDIGGFLLELRRFHRERPDLVEAKIEWAAQTDRELRALERALGTEQTLRELREPGIGGACLNCGAVHGTLDRFCATCGEPLDHDGVPATWRTGEFPKLEPPTTGQE
jgi:hypothetical protein